MAEILQISIRTKITLTVMVEEEIKNTTEDTKVEDNLETMHLVTGILQITKMREDMPTHPMNMRILLSATFINLLYTFPTKAHIKKIIPKLAMIEIKIKLVTTKVKMM